MAAPLGGGVRQLRRTARSARGCTSRASASCPTPAGPSAAATTRSATATRCRASTSPGAPARGSSRRSSAASARRPSSGLVTFKFRHRVDELTATGGAVDGVAGKLLEPSGVDRGVKSSRTEVGDFELRAQAVIVTSRRHRREPRPGAAQLAQAAGRPAQADDLRRSRPRRRADDPDRRGRGRERHQPRPDVALRRGDRELEPDLVAARDPDPAGAVVALAGRARRAAAGAAVPRLRHARDARAHHEDGPRPHLVRADAEDHREGVRAVGLGAEPRHHEQERARGAVDARRLRRARAGRGVQAPRRRTSSSATTCATWSTG